MAISIIAFFLYLSSLIFQLLVEVLKLKKLRLIVKSEKRFQEIKQKISKVNLRNKIKKGKFTSLFPLIKKAP